MSSGSTVRITRGRGVGQERLVASNTTTVLTLTTDWVVEPDETSFFVVAESNWQLATSSRTSPVKFEVPNREGATVHISGRAANVRDAECPYAISPLTRWRINGAEGSSLDLDVPGAPQFGFIPKGRGTVELAGVSFENQDNTRTVTAATLGLNYWDELSSPSLFSLGAAVLASDTSITLTTAGTAILLAIALAVARVLRPQAFHALTDPSAKEVSARAVGGL